VRTAFGGWAWVPRRAIFADLPGGDFEVEISFFELKAAGLSRRFAVARKI
jgi:hypothetical protein